MDDSQTIYKNLLRIHNLGKKTAMQAAKGVGISPSILWVNVTEPQKRALYNWLEKYNGRALGSESKTQRRARKEFIIKLGSVRGIRLRQGLPVRGQNTQSNAKTAKKRLGLVVLSE